MKHPTLHALAPVALLALTAPVLSCGDKDAGDTGESEGSSEIADESWSINLITESLDFGEQDLSSSSSQVIILQNNGESDIFIQDLQATAGTGVTATMPDVPMLARGDVANVVVTWAPKDIGPMSGEVTLVLGPSSTNTESFTVPVSGSASGATVVISAQQYDFGDINVGCESELTVTITNTGNAALSVDSVHIEGDASMTVDLKEFELPLDLEPFQSLDVDVTYSPEDADGDLAYLTVQTAADTVASTFEGRGAVDGIDEVTYEVGVTQRATMLWHINEVALPNVSWAYYYEPFWASLPHFFDKLAESRAYYRIAFLWGTDGSVDGSTTYIDHTMSTDQAMDAVSEMLQNGSQIGDNDRNFTSLLAAIPAQSEWLFEDEYWDESKLSLITVQRDVEQSGGSWANYVAQAQAYKDDPANLVFHAIAGPPPSGCGYAEYFSGYYEAVIATDGLFLSVCEEDWDAHMEKIVAASLGGGGEYFPLSGNPLVSTITVYIDDVSSSEGWEYDEDLNSIVFDDESYPSEGTEVRIKYMKALGCG